MNGTNGFRMREAAAFRRNRNQRIVSEEVRNARFANLNGETPEGEAPDDAELEVTVEAEAHVEQAEETQVEQTEVHAADADGAGDHAGDAEGEGEGKSEGDAIAADQTATKKKATTKRAAKK